MAVFSVLVQGVLVAPPETGLRPEPQGVCTLAAGAAPKFGAEAESRARHGKSVFDRHSTQSSIAGRQDPEPPGIRALGVDGCVYGDEAAVYKSDLLAAQVSEYALRALSTTAARHEAPSR
jgi:hypothetical protein